MASCSFSCEPPEFVGFCLAQAGICTSGSNSDIKRVKMLSAQTVDEVLAEISRLNVSRYKDELAEAAW